MKQVALHDRQGNIREYVVVDDEDYENVSKYKWSLLETPNSDLKYAYAKINGYTTRMHRFILGLWWYDKIDVDHVDHNGLNNVRSNLRMSLHSENRSNSRKNRAYGAINTSSKYRGVAWHKATGKWRAYITVKGTTHYLGYYKDEIEAAEAFDRAAIDLCGEFASLNFPD